MELFVNQKEYISTSQRAGVKVIIHEPNATIIGENMGKEMSAGFDNAIQIEKVIQIFYPF